MAYQVLGAPMSMFPVAGFQFPIKGDQKAVECVAQDAFLVFADRCFRCCGHGVT